MKVKWIHPEAREVPGMGIFEPGKEYDLVEENAKKLIDAGLADPVKEARPARKERDD